MLWYPWELAFDYLFVKTLHVVCSERRHEGTHFVQDTAERPNITFGVVGHVSPNLRAGVVGRAGLCVTQSLFDDL
jgi:hypothetical protein